MRKVECEYLEDGTIQYAGRTYLSTDEVKKVVNAYIKTYNIKARPFKEAREILDILIRAGYTVEEIAASTIYRVSEIRALL